MSARLRLLMLVAAPLIAYGSAPWSGFVWDDHKVIEHGRLIGSLRNLPSLFAHDAMFNSDGGRFAASAAIDTYRPLTLSTFFVEHALWGKRAAGYHVVSVLVHAGCVLLLYLVALALGVSREAAWWAALLFAVHPAIGEAVHWINGRSDPLCVLFLLLALLAWLRGRSLQCAAAFLCATLCKETAFLLAPTVLLLLPRRARGLPGVLWPWALGGALGIALRLLALRHVAVAASGGHLAYAALRVPLLWLDGLRSLAVPMAQMPPSLFERYAAVSPARAIAGAVGVALLALIAWRRWRRDDPFPAWALAAALCALAPIALLTADEGWTGWGRYLYPAAPMFALAVATTVERALPKLRPAMRRICVGACAAVLLLCAGQTLVSGRDFADDRAFATAIAADHPQSSFGWSELAVIELNAGNAERALTLAERACRLAPNNHLHWTRAAGALMKLGRRPEAYAAAARALTLDAQDANARYIAAIGKLERHDGAGAAPLLLEAMLADPEQEGPWRTLQQALSHSGPSSPFAVTVRELLAQPRYASLAIRLAASQSAPAR